MNGKNLYIISGCNGAGKTTASFNILPDILLCNEFVNADEIAKGISPFHPENVAFEAGRIMLNRISELMKSGVDFAFETTLSTRSYIHRIKQAQSEGYQVSLLYYWLVSPELAKRRVKMRVAEGGHNIPDEIIERRYINGIKNLFNLYLPLCDCTLVFDNSSTTPKLVFENGVTDKQIIHDLEKFNQIKKYLK